MEFEQIYFHFILLKETREGKDTSFIFYNLLFHRKGVLGMELGQRVPKEK